MKTRRYIATLVLCALSLSAWSQDFARLSEHSIMGTARYIGMGGAMTAIGGDPSAAIDNPAGLGLYRHTEALLSFGLQFDRTHQTGMPTYGTTAFYIPQASLVLNAWTGKEGDEGVLFHNFLFSYQRMHSFFRTTRSSSANDASLGALLGTLTEVPWDIPFCTDPYASANSLRLDERGYVDQFVFDWAMNISNRWFVGAGLQIQSLRMSSDANYEEIFAQTNASGKHMYNENISSLLFTGASCTFSAGAIYRPTGWLRMGLGIQTPSLGSVRTYSSGKLYALTDSLRPSTAPNMGGEPDKSFHLPLHLSTSVAFQIGAYGMVALQYDSMHAKQMDDLHSLRAGFEVIPVLGLYINGGYAVESSFKKFNYVVPVDPKFERQDTYFQNIRWSQYASVAVGYRGTYMLVQAAYQYRWQHIDQWAHENAQPYDIHADTHRIVVTIGWHRY